ncbi:hypothetical protein B484DRAFT_424984 [Ochromonadaceae sp. CCMP2298]|nr:hypothetical protein B484DRAFT_424984 [Ochromonadaceae sp. CCMP2298]
MVSAVVLLSLMLLRFARAAGHSSIWPMACSIAPRHNSTDTTPTLISTRNAPFYVDADVQKTGETVAFEGYRNIIKRDFLLPTGQEISYDILTQNHLSVVVFAWNSTSSTATLIREYHPGAEQFMYGTVAGMYEFHKHTSPLEAAEYELEEEAQLRTDSMIALLDGAVSQPFDKYSTNRFFPYLALDCEFVQDARAMDAEELITVRYDVTYTELMDMMSAGKINVVSTYAILLGVKKLREMGFIVEKAGGLQGGVEAEADGLQGRSSG